jgi:Ca-activated chloride channel family protein
MLSDGEDTGSRMTPVNAAAIAARRGVRIFTVGIGDPEGSGEARVDFETLEEIANLADGQYFAAEDHQGLVRVYAEIDKMVPRETRTTSYRPQRSLVHWPIGAALVLMLVGLGLMLLLRRNSLKPDNAAKHQDNGGNIGSRT